MGYLTWSTSPAEVATALSGWPLFGLLAQVSLRKVGHVYPKWCIQLWSHEDWVYKLMIGPFSVATCSEFGGSVRIQHVIPPNSTAKVILEGSFARGNRGSWELLGVSVLFKGSKGFIDRYTYHLPYLYIYIFVLICTHLKIHKSVCCCYYSNAETTTSMASATTSETCNHTLIESLGGAVC